MDIHSQIHLAIGPNQEYVYLAIDPDQIINPDQEYTLILIKNIYVYGRKRFLQPVKYC